MIRVTRNSQSSRKKLALREIMSVVPEVSLWGNKEAHRTHGTHGKGGLNKNLWFLWFCVG